MDPWSIVAGSAISAIGSFLSSDSNEMTYTPNPTWLKLQEDIMNTVSKGLAAGGYTWDDMTNNNLKRMALESAAKPYAGAQQRITSSMAPYGNVGAMGRATVGLNTARAIDEAAAARNIDIARQEQKLNSYQNLLNTGRSIQDPNLPQLGVNQYNASLPNTTARLGGSLLTGYGTAMNLNQAEQNNNFWQNWLANQGGNPMYSANLTPTPTTNVMGLLKNKNPFSFNLNS